MQVSHAYVRPTPSSRKSSASDVIRHIIGYALLSLMAHPAVFLYLSHFVVASREKRIFFIAVVSQQKRTRPPASNVAKRPI